MTKLEVRNVHDLQAVKVIRRKEDYVIQALQAYPSQSIPVIHHKNIKVVGADTKVRHKKMTRDKKAKKFTEVKTKGTNPKEVKSVKKNVTETTYS